MIAKLAAAALTATLLASPTASAKEPNLACQQAWKSPSSQTAADCRDAGWVIKARLVLNPRGVVVRWNLPACRFEDGSGSAKICGWIGSDPTYGNGSGLSFYVTGSRANRRGHYVWPSSPLTDHPRRTWVSSSLADALAEGSAHDATTRNWQQCWTNGSKVACADGYAETN